jgi:serine protease Do
MNPNPKPTKLPALVSVLAIIVLSACSALPLSKSSQTGLAQSAVGAVSASFSQKSAQETAPTATPQANAVVPASQSGVIAAYDGTLEAIYTNVNPSVVNIHVVESAASSSGSGRSTPYGNQNSTPSSEALGSGFVWDMNGNIVTNNHVISGATSIDVTFSDGTNVPATLVGADPDSDLAVIKVAVSSDLLHPVALADSKQVKVGQLAVAIGNPFGLSGSMSVGIVSALERSLPSSETAQSSQGGSYSIPDIIQTDAAINPGNSGGVLLNELGQVIGVTNAIESSSNSNSGVGFAIPAQIVQRVIPALIQDGKYAHSWLGISAGDLTPTLAKAMNLSSNQRGALIASITAGSPAEKAGLRASTNSTTVNGQSVPVGGDVITAIDGQQVKKIDDLIAYLTESTSVGQKVSLTILRDGKEMSVDVTLAERPAQSAVSQQPNNNNPQQPGNTVPGSAYLGVSGITLSSNLNQAVNLPSGTSGVLIEQVQSGSPAEKAGLKAGTQQVQIQGTTILAGGDVITAVNGQAVSSNQELRAALSQFSAGEKISLSILRDGKTLEVSVTLAARGN